MSLAMAETVLTRSGTRPETRPPVIRLRSAIAPFALAARVALAQPVAAEGESSALRE